jgi:hypothetical protein
LEKKQRRNISHETGWNIDDLHASALSMDGRWIELGMKKEKEDV